MKREACLDALGVQRTQRTTRVTNAEHESCADRVINTRLVMLGHIQRRSCCASCKQSQPRFRQMISHTYTHLLVSVIATLPFTDGSMTSVITN